MRLRFGVALALVGLVLAPSAIAQPPVEPAVEFVALAPTGRISAEGIAPSIPVRLAFSCSVDELVMNPATQILVEFATGALPAFASVNVDPGSAAVTPTDAAHCTDAEMRHYVNLSATVFLQTSAPAFIEQRIPIRASLTFQNLNDTSTQRGPHSTDLAFVPDYVSSFEVEADRYHAIASGPNRTATFQLNLTNRANAASVATFTVLDAGGGIVTTLPEPLALPYPSTEAQVTTVTLAIPDAVYRPLAAHTVTLLVRAGSSDPSANSTSESSIVLTVQGPPQVKRSPGVEALAAVALVAAIALRLRRAAHR